MLSDKDSRWVGTVVAVLSRHRADFVAAGRTGPTEAPGVR
jgi:hypothetical protein